MFVSGTPGAYLSQYSPSSHQQIEAASEHIFTSIQQDSVPEKVVLVLSEGWGIFTHDKNTRVDTRAQQPQQAREWTDSVFRNDPLNQLVIQPLVGRDIRQHYIVEAGVVPSTGATVAGEMRELCRLDIPTKLPRSEYIPIRECLPFLLKKQGFNTTGIHGNHRSFFGRAQWWATLGLDHLFFSRNIPSSDTLPQCGPSLFSYARCDQQTGRIFTQQVLEQPGRHFGYWLTMDSHQPVSSPPRDRHTSFDCSQHETLQRRTAVCYELQHQNALMVQVRQMAMKAHKQSTPAAFVVVGDHAVQFLDDANNQHVQQGYVPYIRLWPR